MKKLLVIVLAVCMVMMSVVPAFALESDVLTTQATPDEAVPAVSDDAKVVEAWEALIAIEDAIINADYAAMETAIILLNDIVSAMSDEQTTEWTNVVENNMGLEEYMNLIMKMVSIEDVKFNMDEYANDKSSVNAYWFVESYDYAKEENLPISEMFEGVDELYEDAKKNMPPEKIVKIYEAYEAVSDAVWGPWVEDFDSAIAGFEAVLDDFNALSEEELEQLAVLMGAESGEEAFSWVLSDWINLNVCDTMVEYYEAYKENPNKDTAATFVDYYDTIMNGEDEELKELIPWCFDEDFDSVYAEAKALFGDTSGSESGTQAPQPEPQQGADSEKTDETVKVNTAPVNTDGTTNAVIVLFSMLILATGFGIFVKKAK